MDAHDLQGLAQSSDYKCSTSRPSNSSKELALGEIESPMLVFRRSFPIFLKNPENLDLCIVLPRLFRANVPKVSSR